MKTKITANKKFTIGTVDRRIYGSFIEHLGRAVYGGIYEPTHETADDRGFRGDVIDLVKRLNVPIVRYPGGNFVSGYNWEDGTGDKSQRPRRLELAWNALETNEVGIDEFQEWAKRAGSEVMMAVNLGTRGADEARNCVEYCNAVTDSKYANMRRQNGFENPFGIKVWCLGNEMDADWQMGHKDADEYGKLALESAKLMKRVDPSIELVVCGSSDAGMPTFGEWERTVLDHTYDYVDYISLHCYYGNNDKNTPNFLARAEAMDRFIKTTADICDEMKEKKNSDKTINLSFDEWNVWYRTKDEEKSRERWEEAPHLLEEHYNFEDALLVGCMLMSLQNNCDRVKIGCLAQLINVIAPIMTENNGKAWKQTIYYPYMYASTLGNGTTLKSNVECDTYKSKEGWDIPYLYTSVINTNDDEIIVFCVNRSLDTDIELDIKMNGYENYRLYEHTELYSDNLDEKNTVDSENVKPTNREITDKIILKKHSWNMLRFKK